MMDRDRPSDAPGRTLHASAPTHRHLVSGQQRSAADAAGSDGMSARIRSVIRRIRGGREVPNGSGASEGGWRARGQRRDLAGRGPAPALRVRIRRPRGAGPAAHGAPQFLTNSARFRGHACAPRSVPMAVCPDCARRPAPGSNPCRGAGDAVGCAAVSDGSLLWVPLEVPATPADPTRGVRLRGSRIGPSRVALHPAEPPERRKRPARR
jgi:hypothetical protein